MALRQFFLKNGLPWTTSIEQSLDKDGYDTVELIKVMKEKEWSALFAKEKVAKQRLALSVFRDLKDQPVNPSNCATEIPFSPPDETTTHTPSPPKKKLKTKHNPHPVKSNNLPSVLAAGFTLKVIKTAEEKKAEREARKLLAEDDDDDDDDDDNIEVVSPSAPVARTSRKSMAPADIVNDTMGQVARFPALPPSDYRVGRCFLSVNLSDPATDDERLCWTLDNILLPKELHGKDLEDYKGYYNVLGCSKSSSDDEIKAAYKAKHKIYLEVALVNHPDKTRDSAKHLVHEQARGLWVKQKEAYETLGSLNVAGNAFADRVNYDLKGESYRKSFSEAFQQKFESETFDTKAAEIRVEIERAEIFAKGHATRKRKKEESVPFLDRVARDWKKTGQQDNKSRVSVHNALMAGYSKSVIAREVRLQVYSTTKEVSSIVCCVHCFNIITCSYHISFHISPSHPTILVYQTALGWKGNWGYKVQADLPNTCEGREF